MALTTDAVFVDRGGVVVATNPAGAAIYRAHDPADLIGRPVETLVPERFVELIRGRVTRAAEHVETDRWALEEIKALDGSILPVEVRTTPVDWEGEPAALVLIRPVSEEPSGHTVTRRLGAALAVFSSVSLQLLRAEDHQLDATIEAVLAEIARAAEVDRAYVIRFTDDDEKLWCSHEWCADGIDPQRDFVQGLPLERFRWSHQIVLDFGRVHVPDLSQLPPEAAAERESLGRYDVRSLLTVPMVVDGRVRGLVGFNAIHRTAVWPEPVIEQVAAVADAIGTALTRRNAAHRVALASQQERQATQLRDRFLARISHELRTPLNSVLGFTELLLLDEEDEQRRALLRQVQRSGSTLMSLVSDVLDLTQLDAGELELNIVEVDLCGALRAAIQIVGVSANAHGVIIDYTPPEEEVWVSVDPDRVIDVFVQVISNGVVHNRMGGSVRICCERSADGAVSVSVTDSGPGIPEDQLDRAFEPFDRLDATTDVPGSGLGLALVRLLLERMGASVGIRSQLGVGTTVVVTF